MIKILKIFKAKNFNIINSSSQNINSRTLNKIILTDTNLLFNLNQISTDSFTVVN